MTGKLILAALLVLVPGFASAEPGSGSDLHRVNRAVEAMQRDGRWDRLIAEGQANKQATSGQASRPTAVFTATAPNARRRR